MMKKYAILGSILLMAIVFQQCASAPQRWPSYERTAEERMTLLQKKIGDGLTDGQIRSDEARVYLGRLDAIKDDYRVLRGRATTQEEWELLLGRLDTLESEMNRTVTRPTKIDETRIEDRFITIQRRIDDGRLDRRIARVEWLEFQARLDAIRSEYLRMTRNQSLTAEERADISRRLDILEGDISRSR